MIRPPGTSYSTQGSITPQASAAPPPDPSPPPANLSADSGLTGALDSDLAVTYIELARMPYEPFTVVHRPFDGPTARESSTAAVGFARRSMNILFTSVSFRCAT
jgi:hypothetical protein